MQNNEVLQSNRFNEVPVHVDILLYRYNYFDNLIISEVKKHAFINKLGPIKKNSLFVLAKDFRRIFYRKFKREVDGIRVSPLETLDKNANSIYFLDTLFEKFKNVRAFNINISNQRNYSRLVSVEDNKQIYFSYKVAYGILDFPKMLQGQGLDKIGEFLCELGVIEDKEVPYKSIGATEFVDKLILWEGNNPDPRPEYLDILDIVYDIMQDKLEKDESILLIKNDY